ncbi:acid protease [Trametes sanguinea]|nr:acid protease [Trametes sanguinea]
MAPLAGVSTFLLLASFFARVSAIPSSLHTYRTKLLDARSTSTNVGIVTSKAVYTTTILVGGVNFTVIVDTGSSDIWVDTSGQQLAVTATPNIPVEIPFAMGRVTGNMQSANVQLGDLVIQGQAFVNATEVQGIPPNAQGVLGLGFNSLSPIWSAVEKKDGADVANQIGNTAVTSLFSQRPDIPSSFDLQLSRPKALDDVVPGTFLIGEHDENFQQVANAPQLPLVNNQHWSVAMDGMNVNGHPFAFNASRVTGVPSGKLVATLDTGFTLPPIPPAAVDAIYSTIPGAARTTQDNQTLWFVPCTASANVSFVFAGQEFFVHPLDLTVLGTLSVSNADGSKTNATACINAFQYLTLDPTEFNGFDLVLGEAFLRNVYASFNFGNAQTGAGPFVQMVSTTPDASAAQGEFQTQRAAALANMPPPVDPSTLAKSAQLSTFELQTTVASSAGNSQSSQPGASGKSSNGGPRARYLLPEIVCIATLCSVLVGM